MHVSPTLGRKDIKRLTENDVEKLQAELVKLSAPKTVNTIIGELSTVFTYAVKKKIVPINITRSLSD